MSGWFLVLGNGRANGAIAPAGHDQHEQLWRLTPAGWAAHQGKRESG